MELRNKKTGEIADLDDWTLTGANDYITIESDHDREKIYNYKSLAEFLEEWEDYTPKEPLIMDEKIRKAVRAWAEASYLRGAIFDFDDGTMMLRSENHRASISFDGFDFCEFRHITAEYHTIAELCGERGEG